MQRIQEILIKRDSMRLRSDGWYMGTREVVVKNDRLFR